MRNRSSLGGTYLLRDLVIIFVAFALGSMVVAIIEGEKVHRQDQKDQDIRSVYNRVEPKEARDGIFRLMEILSSESLKGADVNVQSDALATLEVFLLQFGPALDKVERTGETGYLGLLRALMLGDRDAELFYRRELGLFQGGSSKGD